MLCYQDESSILKIKITKEGKLTEVGYTRKENERVQFLVSKA
jgi:hypothetical protein